MSAVRSSRLSRLSVGLVLVALIAVVPVDARGAASPYGTWLGTPRYAHQPGPADPIEVVVGPVWAQVESTGRTTASHDAPDATSTCTTRYRFSGGLSADGWRIYVQERKAKISGSVGGGPPAYGVCGSTPHRTYRDAVRLRPAGAKLKVEFGSVNPTRETDPGAFDPRYYKSGYLHR